MYCVRQGDVLLVSVDAVPDTAQKQEGRCILAMGEVTGHAHEVPLGGQIWVDVDHRYLEILQDTKLTHQEHEHIQLRPGLFEIVIQREYSPEEVRSVQD